MKSAMICFYNLKPFQTASLHPHIPSFLGIMSSVALLHVSMVYYNAKTLEKRVLDHAQRCESCEELTLVGARKRGKQIREASATHKGRRAKRAGGKSDLADRSFSSSLDTGCTSTADISSVALLQSAR